MTGEIAVKHEVIGRFSGLPIAISDKIRKNLPCLPRYDRNNQQHRSDIPI